MPLPVGWEEGLGCRGGGGPSGMLGTPYHCSWGPTWGQWSAVLVRLISVNVIEQCPYTLWDSVLISKQCSLKSISPLLWEPTHNPCFQPGAQAPWLPGRNLASGDRMVCGKPKGDVLYGQQRGEHKAWSVQDDTEE